MIIRQTASHTRSPAQPNFAPKAEAKESEPSEPTDSWTSADTENALLTGFSAAVAFAGSSLLHFSNTPAQAALGATLSVAGTLSGAVGIGAMASGHSFRELF